MQILALPVSKENQNSVRDVLAKLFTALRELRRHGCTELQRKCENEQDTPQLYEYSCVRVKSGLEFPLATTSVAPLTFAEFEQLPDPPQGWYELHHGELVAVPPPVQKHKRVQRNLRQLLESGLTGNLVVNEEVGFRTGNSDYRIVDLGIVPAELWNTTDDYLNRAPLLVAEVLSPSNRASELLDREQVCFENGCREFWVIDPERHQVKVATSEGRTALYKSGTEIPLWFGGTLAVDNLFQ